jgi:hypothetical protein
VTDWFRRHAALPQAQRDAMAAPLGAQIAALAAAEKGRKAEAEGRKAEAAAAKAEAEDAKLRAAAAAKAMGEAPALERAGGGGAWEPRGFPCAQPLTHSRLSAPRASPTAGPAAPPPAPLPPSPRQPARAGKGARHGLCALSPARPRRRPGQAAGGGRAADA